VLGRDVVVAQFLPGRIGVVQHGDERPTRTGLGAVGRGEQFDGGVRGVPQFEGGQAELADDGEHHAVLLAQQRGEQVVGRDLGVVATPGRLLGLADRLGGLVGPGVGVEGHADSLLWTQ
jgi:hypothetical protein